MKYLATYMNAEYIGYIKNNGTGSLKKGIKHSLKSARLSTFCFLQILPHFIGKTNISNIEQK